jgi:hypothetical protein
LHRKRATVIAEVLFHRTMHVQSDNTSRQQGFYDANLDTTLHISVGA